MMRIRLFSCLFAVPLLLGGCSSISDGLGIGYDSPNRFQTATPLSVPPDLRNLPEPGSGYAPSPAATSERARRAILHPDSIARAEDAARNARPAAGPADDATGYNAESLFLRRAGSRPPAASAAPDSSESLLLDAARAKAGVNPVENGGETETNEATPADAPEEKDADTSWWRELLF